MAFVSNHTDEIQTALFGDSSREEYIPTPEDWAEYAEYLAALPDTADMPF